MIRHIFEVAILGKKYGFRAVVFCILFTGLLLSPSVVHLRSIQVSPPKYGPRIWLHKECPSRNPVSNIKLGTEVNTFKKTETSLQCVAMGVRPLPLVCIHPFRVDTYISRFIVKYGAYERDFIEGVFVPILSELGQCTGFIDIGANIGEFTMMAAGLGHQVVAVEPVTANIVRLVRALQVNGFQDQVTVLQNAVSSNRKPLKLKSPRKNIAGTFLESLNPDSLRANEKKVPLSGYRETELVQTIVMNDLETYCNFTTAFMKIDIESSEIFAFALSSKLLQEIHIPYIMMEWRHVVNFGSLPPTHPNYKMTVNLVEKLSHLGYRAHSMQNKLMPLDINMWHTWTTSDVLWHKVGK